MTNLLFDRIECELGTILVVTDEQALCSLDYLDFEPRMHRLLRARYGEYRLRAARDPAGVSSAIGRYLDGELSAVDAIGVRTGGTPFQQAVWRALRAIPAGTTSTYGAIARGLGQANASRAVGYANSLNPVAIVVPCHRVIGANATLTGYAGGLDRKRRLLLHEGVRLRNEKHALWQQLPLAR